MLALFNFHVLPFFSNLNEKLILVAFMIFIDVLFDQQTMGIYICNCYRKQPEWPHKQHATIQMQNN